MLALQAQLPMSTAARFFPKFFDELLRHGQVDRATAAARGPLRDTPAAGDAWIPVLYTRLSHGKIWDVPGMAGTDGNKNVGWDALLEQISENQEVEVIGCTPVLGPGTLEPLIGSWRDLARRWADEAGFAMAPHHREDLAAGCAVLDGDAKARLSAERIEEADRGRVGPAVPPRGRKYARGQAHRRARPARERLASTPGSTSLSSLHYHEPRRSAPACAVAQGRRPRVPLFPWHERPDEDKAWPTDKIELDPSYEPTPDEPLVYHLLGHSDSPHSLVLTEDDYFAFLTGVPRGMQKAPPVVRQAFVRSALMFLDSGSTAGTFACCFAAFSRWASGRG